MDEVVRLLNIVSKGVNLSQVLPVEKNKSSKEAFFVSNLKTGKYSSDEEAAQDIYNEGPNDVRYKMLKHRLKKKLYNSLLFIDYNKLGLKNHYQRENECMTLLHQAHILRRQYELDLVINLANKVIAIAEQFDFTNHIVTALELKVSCYSENGNIKLFNNALAELEVQNVKRNNELRASYLFQTVNIYLRKSVTTRKNLLPKIPTIVLELEQLWNKTKSFKTFESYYKTSIYYFELKGEFDNIVEMTINSHKWVEEGLVNDMLFDSSYNKFILVYAHLRSKKYVDGLKYAEAYSNDFKSNSINWFSFMENYFLLALHSQNYELSYILLKKVVNNTSYANISNSAKERWSLYKAYYEVMKNSGKAEPAIHTNPYGLSLPEYSKDKLGFNVAILILQFIYFLQKEDSEALLYRIESLKKYILTHLKDTFSLRSKTFLKLLILTVTEDFDSEVCRKKGQRLCQRLIEAPTPGDAYAEIEIVPYEHLWEYILAVLDNKNA